MKKLKEFYKRLNKGEFCATLTISSALIVTSFVIPPQGVIDASVLAAVGELFAFATLGTVIDAMSSGKGVKLSKGNVTIDIDDELEKK